MEVHTFKRKKILKTGGKSEYVYLMVDKSGKYIIKKKYDLTNSNHKTHFKNETKILNILRECPFVPNIIKVIEEVGVIYMTYCGKSVYKALDKGICCDCYVKSTVKHLMELLEKEWGIIRIHHKRGHPVYYLDNNNVCYHSTNNESCINLIDFGSTLWRVNKITSTNQEEERRDKKNLELTKVLERIKNTPKFC